MKSSEEMKTFKEFLDESSLTRLASKAKKGGSATLKGTNKSPWPGYKKNKQQGKMRPGRTGEFDTKIKKKTFTYERD